nr:MAG TPA: hypothetical protein [Caudoviricetes sp.]
MLLLYSTKRQTSSISYLFIYRQQQKQLTYMSLVLSLQWISIVRA